MEGGARRQGTKDEGKKGEKAKLRRKLGRSAREERKETLKENEKEEPNLKRKGSKVK